jgi:hypothetical protein
VLNLCSQVCRCAVGDWATPREWPTTSARARRLASTRVRLLFSAAARLWDPQFTPRCACCAALCVWGVNLRSALTHCADKIECFIVAFLCLRPPLVDSRRRFQFSPRLLQWSPQSAAIIALLAHANPVWQRRAFDYGVMHVVLKRRSTNVVLLTRLNGN